MIEESVSVGNIKSMKKILKLLGFREYIIVDKMRETFEKDGFEISWIK